MSRKLSTFQNCSQSVNPKNNKLSICSFNYIQPQTLHYHLMIHIQTKPGESYSHFLLLQINSILIQLKSRHLNVGEKVQLKINKEKFSDRSNKLEKNSKTTCTWRRKKRRMLLKISKEKCYRSLKVRKKVWNKIWRRLKRKCEGWSVSWKQRKSQSKELKKNLSDK